jgi:Flp pilus assembly protein TadG
VKRLNASSTRAPLRPLFRLLSARENAGVAAIEFAIYALVFLTIVAAVVDIGLLLFTRSELDAAVSAGAEYAANSAPLVSDPTLNTNISDIVNNAYGTGWATSTINVNNGNDSSHCYCPTGTPGNWTWGTAHACDGSSCPGGSGVYGQFVTITANRTVSPLFPAFGFVGSGTISASALVETQ